MNSKKWQAINDARKLLGLGERATLGEIKRAYYRLCKVHHPDTAGSDYRKDEEMMYRLTAAYDLLMRYCEEFRFPLRPDESDIYDAEEWWMHRFGQDPLWSRRREE
jgi:hypothetical protein